jgi:hypothetical protein
MSAGGSFFGGLVGGFGKTLLHNKDLAHEKDMQDTQNRIRVLEAASKDPSLDDQAREHVMQELMAIAHGTPGKPPKGDKGQFPVPPAQIHDAIRQIDAAHPSPVAPPPPPGASPILSEQTPIGGSSTQLPPSASAGVSAPPAPPQYAQNGRMTLTHDQQVQRTIDDAVAVEHAKASAGEQDKASAIKNVLQTMKDNNIEVTPERKMRIIEQVHNIKISSGSPRFGKDQIPADEVPDGALDATTGLPLDKAKISHFREVWNGDGTFKGYTAAGTPKLSAVQQKFQAKVDDAVASNKPNPGESDEDFRTRMTTQVHKQQYSADAQRLIGLGLGNEAKTVNIQRIKQDIANGGAIPYRSAKVLMGWGVPRRRHETAEHGSGRLRQECRRHGRRRTAEIGHQSRGNSRRPAQSGRGSNPDDQETRRQKDRPFPFSG